MLAIYKRELKSYFNSFIGLLFVAVNLALIGLYFGIYNLINGYPYFSYAISSCGFLFLITVPVLTMRILAEEKRNKTDQLILTAPVTVGNIVLGKFFALLTIFAIPMVVTCLYPVIMDMYGKVPNGQNYLAILAFFLYGMTAIAVGLFISALTESQVIAAVLSFVVLFLGYMMNSITSTISATGNVITKLLNCFDLFTPFQEMLSGTLNLRGIFYYISVTALILFFTVQSIQKRRYSVSVKNLSFGAYSTGMIAVATAIVVIANIAVGEMPESWTSVDLTQEKLYSITEQTKEYVAGMQEDVTIYVMTTQEKEDTTLGQTLMRIDELSDRITVEYVDPAVNPLFYTKYTDSSMSSNSLIVVSDKRNKVVDYSVIYTSVQQMDYSTYEYVTTTTGYDGEGQIVSALDYVLTDNMPKVYMTEGHNELPLSSGFNAALKKENVEYATVNLMEAEEIPEDAACLLINAPITDFSADDTEKVIAYLDNGGKVILILGNTDEDMTHVKEIAAYMGLSVADGLVVETDASYYYRTPYYLLPKQRYNSYTLSTYDSFKIFMPYVKGVTIDNEEAEGFEYDVFLSSSEGSFAKKSQDNMEDFTKGEGDVSGPFAVGVEVVKTLEDGEAVMVVYGCEQMFTDEASSMVSGANQVLFTSTINTFVDNDGSVSVSVPVKKYEVTYLTLNQSEALLLMAATTIVLPVLCLIAGFVIWFKRRKR